MFKIGKEMKNIIVIFFFFSCSTRVEVLIVLFKNKQIQKFHMALQCSEEYFEVNNRGINAQG